MNHSFYSTDRTTHLKVVVVTLIYPTAVAGIGIGAHASSGNGVTEAERGGVIRAGQPAMVASAIQFAIR